MSDQAHVTVPELSAGATHPHTAAALTASALLLTFGIPHPLAPVVVGLGVLVAARQARVLRAMLRPAAAVLIPITVMIFVIQGLFYPDGVHLLAAMGPVRVSAEGLLVAWQLASRVAAATLAFLAFAWCVHPADLLATLRQRGLSARTAYLLTAPMTLVGDLSRRLTAIGAAVRSRGIDDSGVRGRVHALGTHTVPLLSGIVVSTTERADLLAGRGFLTPVRPTSLRHYPDSPAQRGLRYALPLLSIALIGWWSWWGPR